jgi:predicted phosphate transport protein (TIGR00153 family)
VIGSAVGRSRDDTGAFDAGPGGSPMNIDKVIKWFMPKEERFHELLEKASQNLLLAAKVFSEIAHATTLEERKVKGVQLKALERDGDQITRQIFEALNSTFITPFDREDIRWLASDLDDILDHLESVAKYLVLFELAEAPEPLRRFSEILSAMAAEIDQIRTLIWDMGNINRIQESMVRVSELENQGDSLYFAVISELFKKGCTESIEILKWKEVYDGLEEACDRCKDFTHVVGNVAIKNA